MGYPSSRVAEQARYTLRTNPNSLTQILTICTVASEHRLRKLQVLNLVKLAVGDEEESLLNFLIDVESNISDDVLTPEQSRLGLDPRSGHYRREEYLIGKFMEEYLLDGDKLFQYPTSDLDFIDSSGRTYDLVGPVYPGHFKARQFLESVQAHFMKCVDCVIVCTCMLEEETQAWLRDEAYRLYNECQPQCDMILIDDQIVSEAMVQA